MKVRPILTLAIALCLYALCLCVTIQYALLCTLAAPFPTKTGKTSLKDLKNVWKWAFGIKTWHELNKDVKILAGATCNQVS